MAAADSETVEPDEEDSPRPRSRRWLWVRRIALGLLVLAAILLVATWFGREQIARNVIDDALTGSGLEARYEIAQLGPERQVVRNLVIGDPEAPNLTIERVVSHISYGWNGPSVTKVEIHGARAYANYRDGQFSMGSLDELLFTESDERTEFPDFPILIRDARGRVDSDYGAVALKLDGEGVIDDGFVGTLAATAPGLSYGGCRAQWLTAYGDIETQRGAPSFEGPLRMRSGECEEAEIANATVQARLTSDSDFAKLDGNFNITALGLRGFDVAGRTLKGTADLSLGDDKLTFQHDLVATGFASPYGNLAKARADGILRQTYDTFRSDWSGRVEADGVELPLDPGSALGRAVASTNGTLAEPLLAKLQRNLAGAIKGARVAADITVRHTDDAMSVIVPEARLRARSGTTLLSISQASWSNGRLVGNLVTAGEGLPRIAGRMERGAGGALAFKISMEEYSAKDSKLALPQMSLRQNARGDWLFDGQIAASGAIPGGSIEGFKAPVKGVWSSGGRVALGESCTPVTFRRAVYYDLSLEGRTINLCPKAGKPLLAYTDEVLFGARTGPLDLSGQLAGGPITLKTSGASLNFPGTFSADQVDALIGERGNGFSLTAKGVSGSLGGKLSGAFEGGVAKIDDVPLDFDQIAGNWRYEGNVLYVEDVNLRVSDVPEEGAEERYFPLFAEGAWLKLDSNLITAEGELRDPVAQRLVTSVSVEHDLGTSVGNAVIDVPGLVFDKTLQPEQLTYLTFGIVADVAGRVTGRGDIEWTSQTLKSAGKFQTSDMALSAAFGPANGLDAEIEFTDLLGLTTAPDQEVRIGAINAGIEVFDGRIGYQIVDGEVLRVEEGRWPFMGGRLILQPVSINFSEPGSQAYTFEIIGMDAARFVAQMELSSIAASGIFDGTLPMVFDAEGNGRIESGLLISRPPGGNLSYIGALTYEDTSAISNFAFEALRSLDFSQMSLELNGALAGEIISNVKFDGVSQGEGASQNFFTRQLAGLPIRFNVNVRSQNFFQLATMLRSFEDPTLLDPRVQEFLRSAARKREEENAAAAQSAPDTRPERPMPPPENDTPEVEARPPDESIVQPPESEEQL